MWQKIKKVIWWTFIVVYVVITIYLLYNVGNPHSLLRYFIKDTSYDLYITFAFAFSMSLISFFTSLVKENRDYRELIENNIDYIRELRRKKWTDEQIAESILQALGSREGFHHRYARRKLVLFLSKVK